MGNRLLRTVWVILLGVWAAGVQAQTYGIRGGIQQTNLVTDEAGETFGTETGLSLGGFLNIRLPKNFLLSAEGMYTQKIVTQQSAAVAQAGNFDPDVTLELGTIEIPITLSWRAPLGGPFYSRLYGGPLIGVIVDEQVKVDDRSVGDVLDDAFVLTKDAFDEREVGWIAGGGITVSLRELGFGRISLLADLRYQRGITTVREDFAGNPLSRQIRMGAFTALLGVGF
jgi:hypothetical protein